jgi:hypothetical protein
VRQTSGIHREIHSSWLLIRAVQRLSLEFKAMELALWESLQSLSSRLICGKSHLKSHSPEGAFVPLLRANALQKHGLIHSTVVRFQKTTLNLTAMLDVPTKIAFLRITEVRSESTGIIARLEGSLDPKAPCVRVRVLRRRLDAPDRSVQRRESGCSRPRLRDVGRLGVFGMPCQSNAARRTRSRWCTPAGQRNSMCVRNG